MLRSLVGAFALHAGGTFLLFAALALEFMLAFLMFLLTDALRLIAMEVHMDMSRPLGALHVLSAAG